MSDSHKVALVTASSAGLGAATARGLALTGFRTVINNNSNDEKANVLVNEISKATTHFVDAVANDSTQQDRCIAIKADMSQPQEIQRLMEETVRAMGRLDVVISNQGWTRMRNFNDLDDNVDETDWDGCFNMNVKSHLWLFHAAQPQLNKTEGCFVSVASLAGVIPSGSSIVCESKAGLFPEHRLTEVLQAYSVTKAAQLHLVKALAKISGPAIRVNSVSPGILLTVSMNRTTPTRKSLA